MYSDLISLADLTGDEITDLLDLAGDLKSKHRGGDEDRLLEGKTLGMLFEKPSLRTRVTFEIGIFQLGGYAVFMETRLGERESVPDMARNLDRWVDFIVARTHSHDALLDLARHSSVPVINALSNKLHPCQVLADAMTIREHRGKLAGQHVAFVGDGNNVYASWAELAARIPIDLTLVCPEGYEGDPEVQALAARDGQGRIRVCHDPEEGIAGADVVYTDVWTSMGQESEKSERLRIFSRYQVDEALMKHAKKDAIFMHCLPAHRGEEVAATVIDGPRSVVFDEAENRLHAQKAVMVSLVRNRGALTA